MDDEVAGAGAAAVATPPGGSTIVSDAAAATPGATGDASAAAATGAKPSEALDDKKGNDEQGKGDAAAAAATGKDEGVPEAYALKLPDGTLLDAGASERTGAIARTLGLSNAKAQTVLELVHAEVAGQAKAALDAHQPNGKAWEARVDGWRTEALADTEIGGTEEKLKASGELAFRAIAKFGGNDAKTIAQFLQDSGYGSHPAFVRFLSRIGRAMGEGTIVQPAGTSEGGRLSTAQVMYPDAK